MRRASSDFCLGRAMRTAMSASRLNRSSLRLLSASSRTIPRWFSRKLASIGGSTSHPIISLAAIRTVPRSAWAPLDAVRRSAADAAAMASAWPTSSSAAGVAVSPCGERENSDSPRAPSSASMCRPTVGCVNASFLAAPDRLPSRATSRKVRNSSQPGSLSVIQNCITWIRIKAISFRSPDAILVGIRAAHEDNRDAVNLSRHDDHEAGRA